MAKIGTLELKISITPEPLRWRHIDDEQPDNGATVLGCIKLLDGYTVANVCFLGAPRNFAFVQGDQVVECEWWAQPILLPEAVREATA